MRYNMYHAAPIHPLLEALEGKKKKAQQRFEIKHADAHRWLSSKGLSLASLRERSAKLLAGATLGSTLLLISPQIPISSSNEAAIRIFDTTSQFLASLKDLSDQALHQETEEQITENIKKLYGHSTSFSLDGHRLPQYVGMMGLEQHLYRFPGDTLAQHAQYQQAGIAPARGAFGYFDEVGKPKEKMIAQEEYYIVLQTFRIPEWNSDWHTLKDWYKFRKFFVINPENGKAVVAVLGDSGPAVWTGKQFGGSPEVMAALGWYPKQTKGKMMILFLDDPAGTVPLGPVTAKEGRP